MALPNPKKPSLNQVLKLVDQLPSEEQEQLRQTMNSKSWAQRWDALAQKVREQNSHLPPISDEEIANEFMTYREEKRADSAQSSN